jgi:5'-nucleotidase
MIMRMTVVRTGWALALLIVLAGCATPRAAGSAAQPVPVRIIAFNDFHGALQPPRQSIGADGPNGAEIRVPAGGAAYLASAVRALRQGHANTLTVAAGDLISASPLASAMYLDEPAILALNRIGLDYSAVGNHEFDRGRAELLRMQNGGCAQHTRRTPCAVDRSFPGARFRYLAANVLTENGSTLFPAYAIRRFGSGRRQVTIGIIGLVLRDARTLVPPDGVAGLTFTDEADSINALVPRLRAEGADAIVVLIHQGIDTTRRFDAEACPGATGGLLPILARLDPRVDIVVAGHVHRASLCDYGRIDPTRPILVTNAERNGEIVTAIDLAIDPVAGRVVSRSAHQTIVQGEGYSSGRGPVPLTDLYPRFPPDPEMAALVGRYAEASRAAFTRVVGRFQGRAPSTQIASGESVLGDLVADSYLDATRAPENGGAQIAFINQTSVRADIDPAANGDVSFGQLFTAQPFGNTLVVKSFTGREIRAILEQQFASGANTIARPVILIPSSGFTFSYDVSRPAGERIIEMRLDGQPVVDEQVYRVAMNSFLSAGGDNFSLFVDGRDPVDHAIVDLDALERYIAANSPLAPPAPNRITRLGPPR